MKPATASPGKGLQHCAKDVSTSSSPLISTGEVVFPRIRLKNEDSVAGFLLMGGMILSTTLLTVRAPSPIVPCRVVLAFCAQTLS